MSDSRLVPWPPEQLRQSRTRWGVEFGGLSFAVTRTREERLAGGPQPTPTARTSWGVAIGAFASLSALGLMVVGASATRPVPSTRYSVVMPVPEPAKPRLVRAVPKRAAVAVARITPEAVAPITDEPFGPADAPYVARALATGAFQEWEDDAGQRRFLTAGPARTVGGKSCRDMALLIRLAEGGSRVRSAERCTTGPVSEATPPEGAESPEAAETDRSLASNKQ